MIPLNHDVTDETELVFGGVAVGAREARRFDSTVASISTGATTPILSERPRTTLAEALAGAGEVARRLGELRTTLDITGIPADRRREALKSAVNAAPLWTALRSGEVNRVDVIEDVLERADAGGGPS